MLKHTRYCTGCGTDLKSEREHGDSRLKRRDLVYGSHNLEAGRPRKKSEVLCGWCTRSRLTKEREWFQSDELAERRQHVAANQIDTENDR